MSKWIVGNPKRGGARLGNVGSFGAQETAFEEIRGSVAEKLTRWSKTEMENFIRAEFED